MWASPQFSLLSRFHFDAASKRLCPLGAGRRGPDPLDGSFEGGHLIISQDDIENGHSLVFYDDINKDFFEEAPEDFLARVLYIQFNSLKAFS